MHTLAQAPLPRPLGSCCRRLPCRAAGLLLRHFPLALCGHAVAGRSSCCRGLVDGPPPGAVDRLALEPGCNCGHHLALQPLHNVQASHPATGIRRRQSRGVHAESAPHSITLPLAKHGSTSAGPGHHGTRCDGFQNQHAKAAVRHHNRGRAAAGPSPEQIQLQLSKVVVACRSALADALDDALRRPGAVGGGGGRRRRGAGTVLPAGSSRLFAMPSSTLVPEAALNLNSLVPWACRLQPCLWDVEDDGPLVQSIGLGHRGPRAAHRLPRQRAQQAQHAAAAKEVLVAGAAVVCKGGGGSPLAARVCSQARQPGRATASSGNSCRRH